MEISNLNRHVHVSDLPLDRLTTSTQVPEREKVAEVSRQFEAILLRQIFTAAQKPLLAAAPGNSAATGIYQDMITERLAEAVSHSGAIGLAKAMGSQLSRELKAAENEKTDPGTSK
jgi:Rod binding domain-containing protein